MHSSIKTLPLSTKSTVATSGLTLKIGAPSVDLRFEPVLRRGDDYALQYIQELLEF